jgi:hypothetical protein
MENPYRLCYYSSSPLHGRKRWGMLPPDAAASGAISHGR